MPTAVRYTFAGWVWGKQYACFSQKGETIICLCVAKMLPETVDTLISIPLANAVELLLSHRSEYKVLLVRISESGYCIGKVFILKSVKHQGTVV